MGAFKYCLLEKLYTNKQGTGSSLGERERTRKQTQVDRQESKETNKNHILIIQNEKHEEKKKKIEDTS